MSLLCYDLLSIRIAQGIQTLNSYLLSLSEGEKRLPKQFYNSISNGAFRTA